MKNKKYNILLADAMMLPFNRICFNKNDLILDFVAAYENIIQNNNDNNLGESRKSRKKKYNSSHSKLISCFSDDYRWSHFDDVFEVLNMFFPAIKLIDYFDKDKKDIGRFYIQYIMDIARTFITFRDGLVSIRNWSALNDPFLNNYNEFEKIDLWNNISRTVTVDLFIAATYVNFGIEPDNMFDVPNLVYLADMPLKLILDRGVAETHMHANAGLSYQHIWEEQMSLDFIKGKSCDLWYCTLFRYYSAYYTKAKDYNTFEEFVFYNKDESFVIDWFKEYIEHKEKPITSIILGKCKKIMNTADITKDLLFDTVYLQYMKMGTSAEIFWYRDVLKYLQDNYEPFLCECFLNYIRIKNDYFKDKIQKTIIGGLDYFQRIYDSATDTKISDDTHRKYYSIFSEQCKTGNLSVLEMKIVPRLAGSSKIESAAIETMKKNIIKQIKNIAGAYREYILNQKERYYDNFRFPQFGIIYHFIKRKDSDNFSGINCAIQNRSEIIECFDYNTMRKNCKRYLKALHSVFLDHPILTDYIVGIDAASLENSTEPWVFAPVFRAARSFKNTIPYSAQKSGFIQNIGFTYHVGEDFRHIVSGLRHIDEVLEHFDYRSGDRLGHALALGVDIDYLVMQNSMVAIPIMEYLENLLWMWKFSQNMSHTINVPKNLEFKIMNVAAQIYGNELNGIDVYVLWQVYNAKFDELEESCLSQITSPSFPCELNNVELGQKWNFSKLLCSHYCPCYYEIYNKSIFVPTDDYVLFYKDLQKSLIQKVENMGIYVETNPSSNTAIGDIPSILDHPIVRLNNRGLNSALNICSSVLTTINSDDPVVFSTFVENEISYIYYALLNVGCNREEALEWIDKIREHGINSSFIKHKKQLAQIEKDLEQILKIE